MKHCGFTEKLGQHIRFMASLGQISQIWEFNMICGFCFLRNFSDSTLKPHQAIMQNNWAAKPKFLLRFDVPSPGGLRPVYNTIGANSYNPGNIPWDETIQSNLQWPMGLCHCYPRKQYGTWEAILTHEEKAGEQTTYNMQKSWQVVVAKNVLPKPETS